MKEEIKILKALGDETRLRIIQLLMTREKCVCEIHPNISVGQSTTSTHLRKLKNAGIIKSRREGKKVYYKIIDKRVIDVLRALDDKIARKSKIKKCCMK